MAKFDEAYQATMTAEGGYANDPQDPGGETYKGVSRKSHAKWAGWVMIDLLKQKPNFPENLRNSGELELEVKKLYEVNYWHKVQGDDIKDQDIADSIFDFAVNVGPRTSAKLAQISVGAEPDGVIGPLTLKKLNADNPRAFLSVFAISKISRYVRICEQRKESRKYFFGWVRRTLEGL